MGRYVCKADRLKAKMNCVCVYLRAPGNDHRFFLCSYDGTPIGDPVNACRGCKRFQSR